LPHITKRSLGDVKKLGKGTRGIFEESNKGKKEKRKKEE